MAYPQIIYDPGTGQVTLTFTYPPTENAGIDADGADEYEADRSESVSGSGLLQTVTMRVDRFRTLNMRNVPIEDIPAWSQFLQFAIQGFTFDYFEDANSGSSILCTLAQTNWTPKFGFRGMKTFVLRLRLAESGQDIGGPPVGPIGTGTGNPPTTLAVTSPAAGAFSIAHGLGTVPAGAVPVMTSDGMMRLQRATQFDATNVYLNASDAGLTAVVYLFS